MDHSDGGRGEAIAAVQDEEQFYGDDDDFDDLYSDVNVGEGFLHSARLDDEPTPEAIRPDPRLPPPLPPQVPPVLPLSEKAQAPGAVGEPRVETSSVVFDQGIRRGGGETAVMAPPSPPGGINADLGQNSGRNGEIDSQIRGGGFANVGFQRQGGGFGSEGRQGGSVNGGGAGEGGFGGTTLFVGELHWWTTDADLELELSKYGQVKEIKFFDEKASGKSKGYCQVDFYDPMAAAACKEGMNGHLFNGRPCVVAFASPATVRRMGEAQVNNQTLAAQPSGSITQKGRGGGGGGGGQQMGGNYGRGGGGWGRGGRGQNRSRMGGRGIVGNGGVVAPPPPVMHPGAMIGQGFDPTGYGAVMGRMGGAYRGFPAGPAAAPFPGFMPSFPPVVAPHVNPAFFGRGVMPAGGVGMWPDPNMGGWTGEEQSSYGDDAASGLQYGEGSHGKDRAPDRERSGASDRRHEWKEEMDHGKEWSERRLRDDREPARERDRDWERDRGRDWERERDRERERERERERDKHRDGQDRHGDHHRHRDREFERGDDRDRGRSSRPRSK